ncbi:MAG: carbohydrate kinase family protein [Minisyncoccia bacterium]
MFDIITIGSVTRDVFLDAADLKTIKWQQTPSQQGYILPIGDKLEIKNIFFTIGGNAANAAVTFARQGFKTACIGRVGRDVAGKELKKDLLQEKVNVSMISVDKKLFTAYSVLLLKNGERTILSYHGASNDFNFSDFNINDLQSKWWYLSLAGESYRLFPRLISWARKNKIAIAFNPSGYHLTKDKNSILSALKDITFLVLNEEEAALLTGIPFKYEKKVFQKLDDLMPGILAVTNGNQGVTVSDGKFIYRAGVFKEKKLIDRTGAGDAFGSGFVAGLMFQNIFYSNINNLNSQNICYAIRLATANATSVVEKIGATSGILNKKEFFNKRWSNLKITIEKIK